MKGSFFEDKACEFVTRYGLKVIQRNFRCRHGEIDIIARDRACIVFIEVKARAHHAQVSGAEAVEGTKQEKIRRAANFYSTGRPDCSYRFDVLEIVQGKDWRQYNWIKNAFDMST